MVKNDRQLSWNEVCEVRQRYKDDKEHTTVRSLASEYGISKSAMHKILKRETYKDPLEEVEADE